VIRCDGSRLHRTAEQKDRGLESATEVRWASRWLVSLRDGEDGVDQIENSSLGMTSCRTVLVRGQAGRCARQADLGTSQEGGG